MSPLARAWEAYRTRRVVHVNGNILLAGVVSATATAAVVELCGSWLEGLPLLLVFTALVDGAFDVLAFVALHALVSRRGWEPERGSLVADTARLQGHRFVLVPLFLGLASGGQGALTLAGAPAVVAVWVPYVGALAITRGLHTWYGWRTGLWT